MIWSGLEEEGRGKPCWLPELGIWQPILQVATLKVGALDVWTSSFQEDAGTWFHCWSELEGECGGSGHNSWGSEKDHSQNRD